MIGPCKKAKLSTPQGENRGRSTRASKTRKAMANPVFFNCSKGRAKRPVPDLPLPGFWAVVEPVVLLDGPRRDWR